MAFLGSKNKQLVALQLGWIVMAVLISALALIVCEWLAILIVIGPFMLKRTANNIARCKRCGALRFERVCLFYRVSDECSECGWRDN